MKEPSPSTNPVINQGVTPASAFDTGGVFFAIVEYDLKFFPKTFNFSLSDVDLLLRLR
jgi:hypothetical protein